MMDRRRFGVAVTAGLAGLLAPTCVSLRLLAAERKDARPFRLSVMLWTLRPKYSAAEGIELVDRAGYAGFELVDEDKHWSAAELARVRARMDALGVVCDAMSGVETGFAEAGAGERLANELTARMAQAERLGCRRIILLSGKRDASMPREAQHRVCVKNLRRAGSVAAAHGCELLIEPIDALENPSIYLTQVAEAFAIVRETGQPAVKVLYDVYHEARGLPEGAALLPHLLAPLEGNMPLLGLVHVADVPGRHAPGTGLIDYTKIYAALRAKGYRGWMAMEFLPIGDAETQLRAARRDVIG